MVVVVVVVVVGVAVHVTHPLQRNEDCRWAEVASVAGGAASSCHVMHRRSGSPGSHDTPTARPPRGRAAISRPGSARRLLLHHTRPTSSERPPRTRARLSCAFGAMASFFSQVSSFIGRTNISSNYSIDDQSAPAIVGLWKVYKGTRSSASAAAAASPVARRDASIWVHRFDHARGRDKDAIVAQARKEASALARLRHPCVLEVIEPLEETRAELTFATEPIVAPLRDALAHDHRADVQLDEVEVQKGLLTVARALEFLHQANMVHGNLTPDAVLINAKGDWKLAGFGFLTPLQQPDGSTTPWSFPEFDASLPAALSRDWDYLAPEYALDEQLVPANDMYSLGCVVYATNSRGEPPFRNRHAATTLRQHADSIGAALSSTAWSRLGRDLLDLLSGLLTRYPGSRLTAAQFQDNGYFNNVLVSTLKFMERDSFAGRQKEERVSFLKGLLKVLPQFSDRLLRRKVMPALLELMSDRSLLPFILPNVFFISKNLSLIEFQTNVLPKLEPLFPLADPPQNQRKSSFLC